MQSRKMFEEKPILLKDIELINNFYEDWLIKNVHKCTAPVFVINASLNLFDIKSEYKQFEEKIKKLLN